MYLLFTLFGFVEVFIIDYIDDQESAKEFWFGQLISDDL